MNKYHFVHVPGQDMFSGLVHGSFHALRTYKEDYKRPGQLAVVYLDITAHAATSALYAILKRPHVDGMMPCAYIDNSSVRGFTAAREFSVFLSPSLNFVDQKQLGKDLLRFFTALETASHTHGSMINVYMTSDSLSQLDALREASYEKYCGSVSESIDVLSGVESNISIKNLSEMVLDLKLVAGLSESEIRLGNEYMAFDMHALKKFVDTCVAHGMRIVFGNRLHREYFRKAICKY